MQLSIQMARQGWRNRGLAGLAMAATCLAALALSALTASTGASTDSRASAPRVVIHGTTRGSTLALNVRRNHLVLKGRMARRHQHGCRFRRHHLRAVCRLAGKSYIRLKMGPRGDFVRVEHRLPLPLVVSLGRGSDKFIGNGERDICFPGASRRNRCVGGPGNDTCITGPRNSDCVGGTGNDYCEASTGSDGCWGGPGRDVCRMGPGHDGCHGEGGNDRLYGGSSSDQLYGGRGYDYCDGGPGVGKSHTCEAGPRH
jgi:hypothetical protein